jgi:rubrerythrin
MNPRHPTSKEPTMPTPQPLSELLYQALETEQGGIKVYETAIRCAVNEDLKHEWTDYLEQTREHERVLRETLEKLGLDADAQSPGRAVVRHIGESLVMAMTMAQKSGAPREAAELVAAECVILAETKDHANWELIGQCAKSLDDKTASVLKAAYDEVEEQEDHHLYHTKGWARELWLQSLGLPAVLPPPEEVKQVETAIGAAKAEASRESMLGRTAREQR